MGDDSHDHTTFYDIPLSDLKKVELFDIVCRANIQPSCPRACLQFARSFSISPKSKTPGATSTAELILMQRIASDQMAGEAVEVFSGTQ